MNSAARIRQGLILVCCLLLSMTAAARQNGIPGAIAAQFSDLAAQTTPAIGASPLAAPQILQQFYARRDFAPVWDQGRRAQALIDAVRDSGEEGLSPADYHFSELVRRWFEVAGGGATDPQRAQFDLLMTDAAIRLGYHLWFGKVDPVSFDSGWNLSRRVPGFDPVAEIERALASPDLAATLRAMQPDLPLYASLKRELARYNRIALAGGWEPVREGATLRPGERDARVPALRRRLAITGELPAGAAGPEDPELYDEALAQAVREFQRRTGMTTDAAVGRGTLAELNVPVERRIRQLRVNLDRGRVLLYDLPSQFVVVNIAAQEVYYARDQKVVWSARAQVGRDYRQTPEYRSDITYLVLNPTWTVPPGIIRGDILPAAKRDPASITKRGLRVFDAAGHEVAPGSVDWRRFNSGHIPYTLRQDPGPDNALGRVKFMFPNPYAVYLHDTPSKALFERDQRLFSSGCVRIERAFELAELLLDDQQRWNRERLAAAVAEGRLQNVTLARKVPVLLVYWSAWVDASGALNFRPDIYKRDEKWSKALDEPFRFRSAPL